MTLVSVNPRRDSIGIKTRLYYLSSALVKKALGQVSWGFYWLKIGHGVSERLKSLANQKQVNNLQGELELDRQV